MPIHLLRLLKNSRHKHFIDYLADVNSGISAVALFPQLFALASGKPTIGLSPLTFFLIAGNSILWLAYGFHRRIRPLIFSSTLNTIASVGILVFIYI